MKFLFPNTQKKNCISHSCLLVIFFWRKIYTSNPIPPPPPHTVYFQQDAFVRDATDERESRADKIKKIVNKAIALILIHIFSFFGWMSDTVERFRIFFCGDDEMEELFRKKKCSKKKIMNIFDLGVGVTVFRKNWPRHAIYAPCVKKKFLPRPPPPLISQKKIKWTFKKKFWYKWARLMVDHYHKNSNVISLSFFIIKLVGYHRFIIMTWICIKKLCSKNTTPHHPPHTNLANSTNFFFKQEGNEYDPVSVIVKLS